MRKFNVKSFTCGLLIGIIGIATVYATGGMESAEVKVLFNSSIIPLKNSFIAVDGKDEAKMYMTVKEILEYLGYNVEWNGSKRSIIISTKTTGSIHGSSTAIAPLQNITNNSTTKNETDKQALEIMQKTGNWNYVEPFFPSMTSQGVEEVVVLYIQKTGNYEQAEAALPYIIKDDFTTDVSTKSKTQSDYDTLASKTISKTSDIYSIMVYIPHMSTDKVDTMVKDYIHKTNAFNCIYAIRQYMSTKSIDDTVKSYVDRTSDYGTVSASLQFMSADASDYVAKKYINEEKDQQYSQFFKPYLKED